MEHVTVGEQRHGPRIEHALVLGASMAGLCAAAALARRAARVTVVERDVLPRVDEPRRGVPQGRHLHLLLPAGLAALTELFPGITEQLRDAGAQLLDAPKDFAIHVGGGRLALTGRSPAFRLVGATRPLIEGIVRERVRALPNARIRGGHGVLGLSASEGGRRIRGARIRRAQAGGDEEHVEADLVVDATGRGSRTPRWIRDLGFQAPDEARVQVDVRYTTRLFRRLPGRDPAPRVAMVAMPPGRRRGGVALAVEGGRWQVVLAGILGEEAPGDLEGFRAYAGSLWCRDIADLIEEAEPIGDAATGAYPANTWRRYDRLARFPQGLVVIGDALCPLNPLYAQGMSVAALEGRALGRALDAAGPRRVGPAFFRRTRGLVSACWTQAVDQDLRHPEVRGPRSLRWRLLSAYGDRLARAAHRDPAVARALFEVMCLVAPAPSLMRPRMLLGALSARVPPGGAAQPDGGPATAAVPPTS